MDKNSTKELTIVRLSIIEKIGNFLKKLLTRKMKGLGKQEWWESKRQKENI